MALGNGHGHDKRVAVPSANMLLRERIKRLMGKGTHVSWKSLPEVKSSGLLETLTERQIALEELKFSLITCEVLFNTEMVELLSLSKQSVSWADPLPNFHRRTIATTIERVKRCSDRFLDAFEKHWNMRPTVSLTVLNTILQDLAPQFQNYITYCTFQEDLHTVLCTAMRSKRQVVAASFSDRLNLERDLLPLQHLNLYRLLLQDIRSMLVSTTNHLDNFHCNRILADITKLLEECYKLLAKLHGSQYVENISRLLDESVSGFEREPRQSTISKHQKLDPKIVSGKETPDSVNDTDCTTSEVCTQVDVNKHISSSVKDKCKYLDHQIVEKNCRDMVKRSDECNTLKRQDQVCRKTAVNFTLKNRSSQFIRKRCAMFEGGGPHNFCKTHSCHTNSSHSASQFTNIISNSTVADRKRSLSMYETVYRSLRNHRSENKLNISVDNNKPSPVICSSSSSSSSSSRSSSSSCCCCCSCSSSSSINSSNNNNNKNNQPPKSTLLISADSCGLSVSKLSRNMTSSEIESFCAKDVIRESSVRDSGEVEKYEQCDAGTQLHSRLNTPTSAVPSPFRVQHKTIKTHSSGDNFHSKRFQTESGSFIYKVKIEVQCTPPNEEVKCSSLSNLHYNDGSPASDSLSSITEETSYTEELSIDVGDTEQSPKTEQLIFVSFCDLHCTSTAELPSQEENVEIDELSNDYKPMNESFRRNCYQFKPVTPSELLNKNASGVDDCGNVYEECKPCDSSDMNAGIYNNSMLSGYEVPLYQVYNFETVKHSKTNVEENVYTEPDEHVYEEITFYSKGQPKSNGKNVSVPILEISKPSGNNQHRRWVDTTEVANSGLLAEMDAKQVALQEAKYEVISSESSYYKSLLILENVFVTSKELTDTAVLRKEDHTTLFSSVRKAKQCSEKFLSVLLDGWSQDLELNYLCHAVSKFVSSGSFQVYVDCCGSQIFVERTLQQLMLTNSKFTDVLSKLEVDPVCQTFSLQSFLILPMQRVTRLPMLVQAILKRLPSDHVEHSVWTDTHIQLQKIAEECNEAAGRAASLAVECFNQHVQQSDIKSMSLNLNHLPQGREKKQTRGWKIFGRGRQKIV